MDGSQGNSNRDRLGEVMLAKGEVMADNEKTPTSLLDDLAAPSLDPPQRREVADELRKVAETLAGVPDGRHTAHTLRLLAHMVDSG